MPPWNAAPGCAEYQENRSLKPEVIQTISRWVEGGAPEGDRRDLPPAKSFPSQWDLGEPDLTLTITLPKGTQFDLTTSYDNSKDNPDNPSNPPRDAKVGMETTNEMCQLALYYIVK
jgi:hypothetical protein